jgi:lycopene cyclase domain-containing protein
MTHGAYLAALLAAIGCTGLLDRRWRLVLWADWRRACVVLAAGGAVFLVWDLVAVREGFYRRGGSAFVTGVQLGAAIPLEEVFFVVFLCYVTLLLHRLVLRSLARTREAAR